MPGGGFRGTQGRKPKASTILERMRNRPEIEAIKLHRLPPARSHLSPLAKEEWKRMGRYLIEIGMLTRHDLVALELYCAAFARHATAEVHLQGPPGYCPNCDPNREHPASGLACRGRSHVACEYGEVIKNHLGKIVQSPYVAIAANAWSQMVRMLGEFGMSPAALPRVKRGTSPKAGQQRRVFNQPSPDDPRSALGWPEVGKN